MEEEQLKKIRHMAMLGIRRWKGTLGEAEERELENWLSEGNNRQLYDDFVGDVLGGKFAGLRERFDTEAALERIHSEIDDRRRGRMVRLRRAAVAAAVLLPLAGAWYFKTAKNKPSATAVAAIYPAQEKAYLLTEKGERVALEKAKDTVLQVGQAKYRLQGNVLMLDPVQGAVSYQKLVTPAAGIYSLRLPDGSLVMLNAASAIRFPSAFGAADRHVEVEGEVYFEVARDAQRPFRVTGPGGTEIKVLGTSFNVRAYTKEEGMQTVLLTGRVQVQEQQQSVLLQPGEMALAAGGGLQKSKADTAAVAAWRHGFFSARNMPVGRLLEDLCRWYNVKIEYGPGFNKDELMYGEFSREVPLQRLLGMLESTGVGSFRLQERTIRCLPQVHEKE